MSFSANFVTVKLNEYESILKIHSGVKSKVDGRFSPGTLNSSAFSFFNSFIAQVRFEVKSKIGSFESFVFRARRNSPERCNYLQGVTQWRAQEMLEL